LKQKGGEWKECFFHGNGQLTMQKFDTG